MLPELGPALLARTVNHLYRNGRGLQCLAILELVHRLHCSCLLSKNRAFRCWSLQDGLAQAFFFEKRLYKKTCNRLLWASTSLELVRSRSLRSRLGLSPRMQRRSLTVFQAAVGWGGALACLPVNTTASFGKSRGLSAIRGSVT